jgi:acylaminoacyl-peptidase
MRARLPLILIALIAAGDPQPLTAADDRFEPLDVFELEWASDPQISPDGRSIAYVRNFMDIMTDARRSNIWLASFDGTSHRPLTSGNDSNRSPRWSPSGDRLLFVSSSEGSAQLHMRWMDSGETAKLTNLTHAPSSLSWSPDGRWIALSLFVADEPEPLATPPAAPDGASWAPPARVIESLLYRADGEGFLEPGHTHTFVLPAEGGTPHQVTSGDFDHGGTPVWTPDGRFLLFSANRHDDWEREPSNSEIYELALADGSIRALTGRFGPDAEPAISPDGSRIAYVGFDDRHQGYQVTALYVMDRQGGEPRRVTASLDRDVEAPRWSGDGGSVYFLYADQGNTKLARATLDGAVTVLAHDVGGLSLDRPYAGGQFSLAPDGRFAFTASRPDHPADLAAGGDGGAVRRLTELNRDLLAHRELAAVEEIRFSSSHDGRPLQGWIAKPPGFEPGRMYPLILEIHGGPFADYGDRFAADIQLFAAAGYVVFYMNPRGSTSYGEEFGNLIHHAYPSQDFDDLMSGVDAVIERGYVDPERLFVTGGSGGGVLTAWIVGHTDRFRAAVSAKPVINWYSFVLTADAYNYFHKYWFAAPPWEDPRPYLERSPLSYVGNVSTPTMLLTGEVDYRTPMSESEQFYQALKLRGVDTALVRIPDASHGIANRPSQLIAKVGHILAWFARYGGAAAAE